VLVVHVINCSVSGAGASWAGALRRRRRGHRGRAGFRTVGTCPAQVVLTFLASRSIELESVWSAGPAPRPYAQPALQPTLPRGGYCARGSSSSLQGVLASRFRA